MKMITPTGRFVYPPQFQDLPPPRVVPPAEFSVWADIVDIDYTALEKLIMAVMVEREQWLQQQIDEESCGATIAAIVYGDGNEKT